MCRELGDEAEADEPRDDPADASEQHDDDGEHHGLLDDEVEVVEPMAEDGVLDRERHADPDRREQRREHEAFTVGKDWKASARPAG